MNRLRELLQDLRTMPGITGTFLVGPEGILATTMTDPDKQRAVGRVYLSVINGALSLGHFVQEIHCSFNNALLVLRPVSRDCLLGAVCRPGVAHRLVDLSLTMTAKSIEEELNAMEELPPSVSATEADTESPAENSESAPVGGEEAQDEEPREAMTLPTEG